MQTNEAERVEIVPVYWYKSNYAKYGFKTVTECIEFSKEEAAKQGIILYVDYEADIEDYEPDIESEIQAVLDEIEADEEQEEAYAAEEPKKKKAVVPFHYANSQPNVERAYQIIYDNTEQNVKPPIMEHIAKPVKYDGTALMKYRHKKSGQWSDWVARTVVTSAAEYFGKVFHFHNDKDYYITANTSFRKRVQAEYKEGEKPVKQDVISCLNNVVIDIDCHKEGYTQQELNNIFESFYKAVGTYFTEHNLYMPNIVHFTPRGVHLWFHIVQDSICMRPLYEEVIERIAAALETVKVLYKYPMLDIDKAASKKVGGVFRAFGSGREVRIAHDKAFKLKELRDNFIDYYSENMKPSMKAATYDKKLMKETQKCPARVVNIGSGYTSEHTHRTMELRLKLIEWGIEQGRACEGWRDKYLFIAYNTAIQVYETVAEAQAYLRELNHRLSKPLSENILNTTIFAYFNRRIAKYGKGRGVLENGRMVRYYLEFKKATMLEWLNICSGEAQEFFNENTRAGQRLQKREEKAERNAAIIEMRLQGKSFTEIAKQLGITRQTASSVFAAHIEEQQAEKERLEAEIEELEDRIIIHNDFSYCTVNQKEVKITEYSRLCAYIDRLLSSA